MGGTFPIGGGVLLIGGGGGMSVVVSTDEVHCVVDAVVGGGGDKVESHAASLGFGAGFGFGFHVDEGRGVESSHPFLFRLSHATCRAYSLRPP